MKIFVFFILFFTSTFAQWEIISNNKDTFVYNKDNGEVYILKKEIDTLGKESNNFIRVIYKSENSYELKNNIYTPSSNTPKNLEELENKIIDSLTK